MPGSRPLGELARRRLAVGARAGGTRLAPTPADRGGRRDRARAGRRRGGGRSHPPVRPPADRANRTWAPSRTRRRRPSRRRPPRPMTRTPTPPRRSGRPSPCPAGRCATSRSPATTCTCVSATAVSVVDSYTREVLRQAPVISSAGARVVLDPASGTFWDVDIGTAPAQAREFDMVTLQPLRTVAVLGVDLRRGRTRQPALSRHVGWRLPGRAGVDDADRGRDEHPADRRRSRSTRRNTRCSG